MKTYEKSNKKRLVQDLLFKEIGTYPSHIVALLGPTPKEYIKKISGVISGGDIFNYEKEKTNLKLGSTLNRIFTVNRDVFYAEPQKIMDLDLMRTVLSEDYLLRHLFEKQKNKYENHKKVFMFTLSLRGTTIDQITNFLSNLLQTNVDRKENKINYQGEYKGIHEYVFFTEKRYRIKAFSYFDTSSMVSILIQYT